jgi:LasA protease
MKLPQIKRFAITILLAWMVISIACNFPTARQPRQEFSDDDRLQTLIPRLQASALVVEQTPISAKTESALVEKTFQAIASPTEQKLPIPVDPAFGQSLLPDSEVIYSPSVADFDVRAFIDGAGGYLGSYAEWIDNDWYSGAGIIERVAIVNSVNPRLLLALLEFRSNWVYSQQPDPLTLKNPLRLFVPEQEGLYQELSIVAKLLNVGYYSWRSGELDELIFTDGKTVSLDPELNAGLAALLYLFSRLSTQEQFDQVLSGDDHFLLLHQRMYGDPWERAKAVEPIFPEDLVQPVMELPFLPGENWSFTGGPHSSWGTGTPRGALDFAPVTDEPACAVSRAWVTASAAGVVTRSERSLLAIDLDGDGFEGTGWVLVYLHLADKDRLPAGSWVEVDDPLGHPSCEGGLATGTHVHIARKYNGEWLPVGGDYPFVLSGWQAIEGTKPYEGFLVKGDLVITASPWGSRTSIIIR